ncbi:hypothetical protein Presley_52 [Acinetobacter phage Presley]|uniref:Uncharacterized protein n=1 Tax=Acinetobacter phage Presley TaxID=1406780 RepID=U5PW29_9CAUD|nr:hypothetical protein Presley_52 [Acinetobacter phage Presley]AGY48119.1 hypothetical protein Presley_52 [Acinetobacter phage Presley]
MTPIDYRIGYRVKVDPKDCITARCRWSNIDWGTLFEELEWGYVSSSNYFKGVITEVKTHKFFGLIQLEEPIFTVMLDIPNRGPYYVTTRHPKLIVSSRDLMTIHYINKFRTCSQKDNHTNGN